MYQPIHPTIIHSFITLFIQHTNHSSYCSFIHHTIHSFIILFIHSSCYSLTHSLTHSLSHSFTHSTYDTYKRHLTQGCIPRRVAEGTSPLKSSLMHHIIMRLSGTWNKHIYSVPEIYHGLLPLIRNHNIDTRQAKH